MENIFFFLIMKIIKLFIETLRLNGPDFSINRVCTQDYMLPPQYPNETVGVKITAGTPVIIPVYSIHR